MEKERDLRDLTTFVVSSKECNTLRVPVSTPDPDGDHYTPDPDGDHYQEMNSAIISNTQTPARNDTDRQTDRTTDK
jgi:hypothetical protein